MPEDVTWTGEWLKPKLTELDSVADVDIVDPQHLTIRRHELPDVVVTTTSLDRLDAEAFRTLLEKYPDTDIVVNIRGHLMGDALALASASNVSLLSVGDAMRALRDEDVRGYLSRETTYRQRMLRQHSAVVDFERLDEARYLVRRRSLPDVTALLISEYALTAERVRKYLDEYDAFEVLVDVDPNCTISAAARTAAAHSGIGVMTTGEFLSSLHHR